MRVDYNVLLADAVCYYRAKFGEYKKAYTDMLNSQFIDDDGNKFYLDTYENYKNKLKHIEFELQVAELKIEEIKEHLE